MKNQYDDIKYKRIGEIHKLKCGATAKIIDYTNRSNVKILIIENNEIRENVRYDHLKDGNVKLLYFPSVFGIGYPGEEGLTLNYSKSKIYKTWKSMLQRCYDIKLKEKYPNYIRAKVCDDWLNYSNFKKWYENNYYEIEGK